MPLDHERLESYQLAIELIAWTQPVLESIPGDVAARDQLERASSMIALKIAEGNEKHLVKERLRCWHNATGSAVQCSACLDVLVARGICSAKQASAGKEMLEQLVRLLVDLRNRYTESVLEDSEGWITMMIDG